MVQPASAKLGIQLCPAKVLFSSQDSMQSKFLTFNYAFSAVRRKPLVCSPFYPATSRKKRKWL